MTKRRVVVTLEAETNHSLPFLRNRLNWCTVRFRALQAQANVIRAKPGTGRARKRTRRR